MAQCCYCENLGIRFDEDREPYDWCEKIVDSPDALAHRDCDYFEKIRTMRTKCPICGGEMWWFGGNRACKECHFIEPTKHMTYADLTQYMIDAFKRCKPVKTNADKIRSLSDEGLENWIENLMDSAFCPSTEMQEECTRTKCDGCWLAWLKSPVKDGNA